VLAKARFRGRDLIETIGSLPIILPPTVMGYYLLVLFTETAIGKQATKILGHPVVGTSAACVIAASIAALSFIMRASRAGIEGVVSRLEQAGCAMGPPRWKVVAFVPLPLARRVIAAGLTLGCVRALGEYGIMLLLGGNIPGQTRTMTLAVA